MKELAYLNKYFWKYRVKFFLGILFIVFTNLFAVYSPRIVRFAFDLVKEATQLYKAGSFPFYPNILADFEKNWGLTLKESLDFSSSEAALKTVGFLAVILGASYFVVYLVKGVFLFFTRQTIIIMSRNIEYDLKNEIFDQYQKLSPAFYKRNNTGDLMNRISEDVSQVRMYLGPGVMYTINLIFLFLFTITFMLQVNVELTLYVLAPLPIMSVLIYYVSTIINRKTKYKQEQQSYLSTLVQEAFSGIRVLKAYTREQVFAENFKGECEEYKRRSLDLVKVDALFFPIILLLIGLSTIITVYIGGMKSFAGEVTLGNIAEFVIYVNMLTWPFAAVGWVTSLIQRASASMRRIKEFLNTEPEIVNTVEEEQEIEGNISFKNVSFTYPESGINALKNVSFEINSGEVLAVVGRTGSGKSTLANLIGRLFEPQEGSIEIDGLDIRSHHLFNLRSQIGYVPQDVFLFSDTIANNISFGLKYKAEKEEIEQAAKDAHILENIQGFKKGFDTILGERGITLSGGQKQRVSIARAIIKKPKILIFDDSLSAVDTETEETILSNLKRIMKGRTSVLISHRISTVKHADKIIVLENGSIAEIGNHQSLLNKNGIYAEMHQQQLLEGVKEAS
ncbi:ABC transporter ATP-binding protein [Luteibaculum oceani]|uniref:ABC transporter ATP-binding protein n=1 Tax=Luteibaculum oceani TaxID=1294296 RepID=A0A5C6V989_9FLAO|nr:ABC transporter ATP-binding protein [Luteibaculum oceani]TXC82012.1 ABC transporter ATP-binding protein [Luteibaculum oceani]